MLINIIIILFLLLAFWEVVNFFQDLKVLKLEQKKRDDNE